MPINIGHQLGTLIGMIKQQLQSGRKQVSGGVAASVDEQQEKPLEFFVGQAVAVYFGINQNCGKIVARSLALFVGD